MDFLNKITPNFLKNLDRYLLLNAPVVWRTRIHYLLFGFIFGNAAILAFVFALPISKSNVPSLSQVDDYSIMSMVFLSFAALYWAYTQFIYKLNTTAFSAKLLTYSLYLAGILILASHYVTLHGAILYRVANVEDTAIFEKENTYINDEILMKVTDNGIIVDEKADRILATYGLSVKNWKYCYANYRESKNAIREAKYFFNAPFDNDLYQRTFNNYLILTLLGFLGIPAIFLILSTGNLMDLFIAVFLQFFVFIGFVLSNSLSFITIESFYQAFTPCLALVALFLVKNKRITKIVHYCLLLLIPFTAWISIMRATSSLDGYRVRYMADPYILTSIVISVAVSVFFFHLISKRLGQPQA